MLNRIGAKAAAQKAKARAQDIIREVKEVRIKADTIKMQVPEIITEKENDMEKNIESLEVKTRAYFLQQGQSIQKVQGILGSNIFVHHLKKWFSILLELVLYLLFVLIILIAVSMPDNPFETMIKVDEETQIKIAVYRDEIVTLFGTIKFLLIVFGLPVLGIALLLGRNRRKNGLIREASKEADQMKEAFDKAIVELKL